jgi:hypothetical protein
MRSHGEVKWAASLLVEDHEDEQELECDRRNDEEVYGDQVPGVVLEEGAPGLRWWPTLPDHVFRDGGLRNFNSDFQQFSMKAWSAPEWIGRAHFAD